MLQQWRQQGKTRGVRYCGDTSTLGKVRGLLEPTPKRYATPLKPGVELRHGVGAILRVQQCIGVCIRMTEVLCAYPNVRDWMIDG
jgi:hypothetical protein